MGTDNTSKLIERIISDAQADADRIIAEAEQRAKEIKEQGEAQKKEIQAESEKVANRQENEILMRGKTNAELEAKKYFLKVRRSLLTEAFNKAKQRINSLSGTDLEKFFARSILKEANGGEVVKPSKAHRESISRIIRPVNMKLDEQGKAEITLGEDSEQESGYLLCGKGYIIECSFDDIIEELKERESALVAEKLF
ncbi:MAG: hypothetical protein GX802_07175 [Clostridiales bacterium]|nr:hypothetical protein [Clostridiales bacterium]